MTGDQTRYYPLSLSLKISTGPTQPIALSIFGDLIGLGKFIHPNSIVLRLKETS